MARIRTIKPEFATDEKLAKLSRDARLTFVLCITQADDDGLLPGNSRQLLAALYPLDETMTDKILTYLLSELVAAGRLRWRETRDGSPILQIVNWSSHQKVDHKAKSLILPHLKPEGEESAHLSRDPREDVATLSRSDLGPRTKDQGPTTVADAVASSPAVKIVRPPRPATSAWVTEGVAWWEPAVGSMTPARFGKALGSIVKLHGWPAVFPDLQAWVADRNAEGKACKLEWYAEAASTRVGRTALAMFDPVTRELTPYGERMTRPDRVSA